SSAAKRSSLSVTANYRDYCVLILCGVIGWHGFASYQKAQEYRQRFALLQDLWEAIARECPEKSFVKVPHLTEFREHFVSVRSLMRTTYPDGTIPYNNFIGTSKLITGHELDDQSIAALQTLFPDF